MTDYDKLGQHSFQEVMRQLNRLCSHCPNCGENACSLHNECGNIGSFSSNKKQAMRIEKIVMEWAAENPEPVYPTFREWLISIGVIDQMSTHSVIADILAMTPIPAELAQKLGIEPNEG